MPAERIVGEVAEIRQYGKIVAHRIEAELQGQLLCEQELLDAYLIETQILPLAKNRLVREVAIGPVRKINAGAVGHRVARDGIRPNAQFVEIKAQTEVDLLGIGGAGTVDAGRVGCGLADIMGNEIDPLLGQFLTERQLAEQRNLEVVVELGLRRYYSRVG